MKNIDNYLGEPRVKQILNVYLLLTIAISIFSAIQLLRSTTNSIHNPISGAGLLLLSLTLIFLYIEITRGRIDICKLAQDFFKSQMVRYISLISWVFQILITIFGSPFQQTNVQIGLFQWGFFVSVISLVTYIIVQFHFVKNDNTQYSLSAFIPNNQILLTLLLASFLGCFIGYLNPNVHVAVEQGQVLANTLEYAPTNPFYVYQAKLWNIWGQLSALALSIGVSEIALSIIFSCLAGMIFSTSVALIGLGITQNTAFSITMPFIMLLLLQEKGSSIILQGYGYPLMLVGEQHTYGMIGMSYVILVLALFILKKDRFGFLLLGFSIMVHPSLGIWLHVTFLLYILSDLRNIIDWFKKGLFALIGYTVSIGSLIWQRLTFPVPYLSADIEEKYLDTIVETYSTHGDYVLYANTIMGNFLILVLLACLVFLLIGNLNYRSRLSLKFIIWVATIGVIGHLFTRFPNYFSNLVIILLPNRFLNVVTYLFFPTLFAILFLLIFQTFITYISNSHLSDKGKSRLVLVLRTTVVLLSSYFLLFAFNNTLIKYQKLYDKVFERFDTPVFIETQKSDDLLLISASLEGLQTTMIQLYSGRPLVMNPLTLDSLPYTVEAALQTDEILGAIYGIDFFDAPPNILSKIRKGRTDIAELWEERTSEDWVELANEFSFSHILTHPGLELQLPIVTQNEDGVTLYQIP